MELNTTKENEMSTTHFQTSASTVACGAKMRDRQHSVGWDLGTSCTDLRKVTCDACMVVATGTACHHQGG